MSCSGSGPSWPAAPPTPISLSECTKPTTTATGTATTATTTALPSLYTHERISTLPTSSFAGSSNLATLESIVEHGREHVKRREQQRRDYWQHDHQVHTALERLTYLATEFKQERGDRLVAELESVIALLVPARETYSALLLESSALDDDAETLQVEFEKLVPLQEKKEVELESAKEAARLLLRSGSVEEPPADTVEPSDAKPSCLVAYEQKEAFHRQLYGRVGELKGEYQEELENSRAGGLALPDKDFEAKYNRDLTVLYGQIYQAQREAEDLRRECEAAGVLSETIRDEDSVEANAEPALQPISISLEDGASATASEPIKRAPMFPVDDIEYANSSPTTGNGLPCCSAPNTSGSSRSEPKSFWPLDIGVPYPLATPPGNINKQCKIERWNDDVKTAVRAQKSGRPHSVLVTKGSAVNHCRLETEHNLQYFHHTPWGRDSPTCVVIECQHCKGVISWAPPQTTPNTPICLLINQDLPLPKRAHTF